MLQRNLIYDNLPSQILGELDTRVDNTQKLFANLFTNSLLPDLIGRQNSWAVIGGAVRDSVLSCNLPTTPMFNLWPDIDIAVSVNHRLLPVVQQPSKYSSVQISSNNFGGLKLQTRELGSIDIWTWSQPGGNNCSINDWLTRLSKVDFGINSLAFLWPQCEILMHSGWKETLEERCIKKLSPQSPRRNIQSIRAIAVALKMEGFLKTKIGLDKEILEDLRWLVEDANTQEVVAALTYLKSKVISGRWSFPTMKRLLSLCKKYKKSKTFHSIMSKILKEWFYN